MGRLVVVFGGELAVVMAVHRLAGPYWHTAVADPAALLTASVGDLLATLLHVGAWLSAWWLLAGTVHDVVLALRSPRGRSRDAGRCLAPVWVQRIVSQAVGSALVLGVVAGPAGAVGSGDPAATPVVQLVDPPVPVVELPTPPVVHQGAPPPAEDPVPEDPVAGEEPIAADPAVVPAGDVGIHVVAPGENLWVIARQHAAGGDGAPVSDREVHAYWVRLVASAHPELRSGDPDLVFPGERLVLPAPTTPDADGGGG